MERRARKWSPISRVTGRTSCCAAVGQGGKGTCTSRARGIERPVNTPRAKKANKDISCLNSEPLRTGIGRLPERGQVNAVTENFRSAAQGRGVSIYNAAPDR